MRFEILSAAHLCCAKTQFDYVMLLHRRYFTCNFFNNLRLIDYYSSGPVHFILWTVRASQRKGLPKFGGNGRLCSMHPVQTLPNRIAEFRILNEHVLAAAENPSFMADHHHPAPRWCTCLRRCCHIQTSQRPRSRGRRFSSAAAHHFELALTTSRTSTAVGRHLGIITHRLRCLSMVSVRCDVITSWRHCVSTSLRQLRSVRRSVPRSVLQTLVTSLVLTRLDYAGIPLYLLKRLQSVMNSAARLVFSSSRCRPHHSTAPPTALVEFQRSELISSSLYKCQHGAAPSYLSDKLSQPADLKRRRRLQWHHWGGAECPGWHPPGGVTPDLKLFFCGWIRKNAK